MKWIGISVFIILLLISAFVATLFFKKEKMKAINIPTFLQEMVNKAEAFYLDFDDFSFKDNIDLKIYQTEWFKNYEYTYFKKIKSQYHQFIIFTKNQDDVIDPIFITTEGYLNIYLLMKEIEFSFQMYLNKNTNNIPKDSYSKFVHFLMFNGLTMNDLYFAPLKNNYNHHELFYYANTLGMNAIGRPAEYYFLSFQKNLDITSQKNKDLAFFYHEEFQKEYVLLEKILNYPKTELLNFKTAIDNTYYLIYDKAFQNNNFGISGIVINSLDENITHKLFNLDYFQFENLKNENQIDLDKATTNSIQNFYAYALKNKKTISDFNIIQLDKKNSDVKKLLNNNRFWLRLLNGKDYMGDLSWN